MNEKDVTGQAGIVDGKIVVTNPQGGGEPAVLYPAEEGLTIIVNGELLESPLKIFEGDVIEITPLAFREEAYSTVKISPDAYTAKLAVYPCTITEYQLVNTDMSSKLRPQARKNIKLEKVLTLKDVSAVLSEKNVVFGVDFTLLKNVIDKCTGEPEIVAKGIELQEGVNGRIEFLASTEVEAIAYDDSSQKKVDFRERYRFPAVKKDDLIARVHPPIPGVSGQTVTGRIIVPRPVKSARFKCGEGVEFLEEKGEIVASQDGRFIVSGSTIKVADLITHSGDVDLESGNIHFSGDIRIYGNIMENALVEAQGNLFVEGNGYGAVIRAGEGIHFSKNLIKCQVEGGLFYTLLKSIISQTSMLEKEYSGFMGALRKVMTSLEKKGQKLDRNLFQRIARTILQKMPPSMFELLAKITSSLKESRNQQFDSLKKTLELLGNLLGGMLQIDGIDVLDNLGYSLQAFLAKGEELLKNIPPLDASYVQNSIVNHSGDINVVGAGSYYSRLKAGGSVNVAGVCRGGTIEAGDDVRVKEFLVITTESVATTSHIRIKVPAHSFIYFDLVHEDVTVQVGKMIYRFDRHYSKIKIGYDSESGMLKLINF